jgi:hypothetical protein
MDTLLTEKLNELEGATLEENFYGYGEAEAVADVIQKIRVEVLGLEDAEVKRPSWWERHRESESATATQPPSPQADPVLMSEDDPPLRPDERERAEAEGQASGRCPFCEGGMDAFVGVHAKDCPLGPPASSPQAEVQDCETCGGEKRVLVEPEPGFDGEFRFRDYDPPEEPTDKGEKYEERTIVTFDPKWASEFDRTVEALMRAVIEEFPGGKIERYWLEGAGGSVNGRAALGAVLREAVKRGVVSVDGRQAQNLAHHGSASHDDKARDLLGASACSDEPVELYSRSEIVDALTDGGLINTEDYEDLFRVFGWTQ